MAKTYVVGNFKGGVGKTKTVTMLAYESAVKKRRKTLVIDLDPQGNATSVLGRTGGLSAITKLTEPNNQSDTLSGYYWCKY